MTHPAARPCAGIMADRRRACPATRPASARVIGRPAASAARVERGDQRIGRRRRSGPSGRPARGSGWRGTAIWRSAKSLTSTAARSASSGGSRRAIGGGLQPAGQVGQRQAPVARRALRAVSSSRPPAAGTRLCRWKSAPRRRSPAIRSASSTTTAGPASGGAGLRQVDARRQVGRRHHRRRPSRWPRPAPDGVLPGPSRPDQQQLAGRPAARRLQRRQRQRIGRRDEEILAPQCGAHRQVEGQLARHSVASPGRRAARVSGSRGFQTAVKPAVAVLRHAKARQHAERRRHRHRDQHADEAEDRAEGRQREQQPDRVQPDRLADQPRGQDVALDELAQREDRRRRSRSPASRPRTGTAPARWPAPRRPARRRRG